MPNPVHVDSPQALLTLSAQGAGTLTSANQKNLMHKGIKVWVSITAITGTGPSLTVTLQGVDPVSGSMVTVLASAALNTTGETVLTIYPGITAVANSTANDVLPPTWNVKAVVAGTGPSVTATIGFSKLA